MCRSGGREVQLQKGEEKVSPELEFLWDTVRPYLSPEGLDRVAHCFPEFRDEALKLRAQLKGIR